MSDVDVELVRLRERVYGGRGNAPTEAELARLAALEDRARAGTAQNGPDADGEPLEAPADDAPPPDEPVLARSSTRPAARRVLTALGAVALLGLGGAIGFALADVPGSADASAPPLPELAFVQTSEDVISADILLDSGIDPASIRYIATIRDFRIYLALPDDGDGRCVAVFTSTDNRPWSAGCASGAEPGAAVFGVDENLSVAIGDPADDTVAGTPIRLSESVTAYVRPN